MKSNDRHAGQDDGEVILRGIKRHKKKPIILERRALPGHFSAFFLAVFSSDWKRWKRYETVEQAMQAHDQLLRSTWNQHFEYRLQTPVGIVTLPVVKA